MDGGVRMLVSHDELAATCDHASARGGGGGQLAVEDVAVEGRNFGLSVCRLGHVC